MNKQKTKKVKSVSFISEDQNQNKLETTEIDIQKLDKLKIDSELYSNIDQDMKNKYIKQFGEIKTGNPINITRGDNIKRHAEVIAFWLREAPIKDYNDKEKDLHKFAMCSTNASNLIERSHKMGFFSEVVDELKKIYTGYLYFNKRAIELLQNNEFDIDFNIPSLEINNNHCCHHNPKII